MRRAVVPQYSYANYTNNKVNQGSPPKETLATHYLRKETASIGPGEDEDSSTVLENLTLLIVPFPPLGAPVSGRPSQPETAQLRPKRRNGAVPSLKRH